MSSKYRGTASKMAQDITRGSSQFKNVIIASAVIGAMVLVLGVGYVIGRYYSSSHSPTTEVIVNQGISSDSSGNIAEGGEDLSTLPDCILDQRPSIKELCLHARTGKYNELGIVLSLDSVDQSNCHDCISVYKLWLEEKAENTTRRNLLVALREIRQNNVAREYQTYLETVQISI